MTTAAVDVWTVALQVDRHTLAGCEALLDAAERARATRLAFAQHRRRYVVSHAAARLLVAQATGQAPQALRWAAGPLGRPLVAGTRLALSLSRSHEWAMLALLSDAAAAPDAHEAPDAPAARIGVDIEADIGAMPEPAWLADHVSAPALARAVPVPTGSTAPPARGWFFDGWTRVEALAKARGTGIAGAVATRWDPWQPQLPLQLPDDEGRSRQWFVQPLAPRALPAQGAIRYHAALAADRPIGAVTLHDLGPAELADWLAATCLLTTGST